MSAKLEPAEKVARAAARIVDSLGVETVERCRETHARIKGVGRTHYLSNGRIVALVDAVDEWRAAVQEKPHG